MGRKSTIPYGLYCTQGFVSANFADATKFSEEDLELLWESLINMCEVDRSASRGLMSARKLIDFKHESKLGNAPAHKLFELVKITPKDEDNAPRSFEDFEITFDKDSVPEGVTAEEKL